MKRSDERAFITGILSMVISMMIFYFVAVLVLKAARSPKATSSPAPKAAAARPSPPREIGYVSSDCREIGYKAPAGAATPVFPAENAPDLSGISFDPTDPKSAVDAYQNMVKQRLDELANVTENLPQ